MRTSQYLWTVEDGWQDGLPASEQATQLVLVFGGKSALFGRGVPDLREAFPNSVLFGCSTAGEIRGVNVHDDCLVATAVQFERSSIVGRKVLLKEAGSSLAAAERLAASLDHEGLVHVLVLSDGLNVNGSELVKGLVGHLPEHVTVTGGLSGDGDRFGETFVLLDGDPEQGAVAVVGLYGDRVQVGYASLGGWDQFGPERVVTRAEGNVLYELDGKSALQLYKDYLGEHAQDLPASALLFPLALRNETGAPVVRTVLGVDESEQSMTFAGDMPVGSYARLMKANFDRLVDGAAGAARTSVQPLNGNGPDLAILISCVGRKMVLGQRVEEEVEAVREVLGPGSELAGFYSYGEISPFSPRGTCELHNQTMTITTVSET